MPVKGIGAVQRRHSAAGRAAVITALLFVIALQVHRVDDGDAWWHLASGRLIATTHAVARADPFSFTAPGAPWVNRQWLFDLGAYAAWSVGGPAGIALAAGALFVVGFAALYAIARRRLPAWAAALLLFLAANTAVERFTIRPEAVTLGLLALYLLALDARPLRPRVLVVLVIAQVVWANCHALSVLGLGVLGCELVGSAAARWLPLPAGWRAAGRRETREIAALALATAAAAAAEACTPFGVAGALFPLRLLGVLQGAEVTSQPIVEHRPLALAELSPAAAFGVIALLVLAGVAALLSWRRWRVSHVLVATAFTCLAFLARRNAALLALGVVPLVATGLEHRVPTRTGLTAAASIASSVVFALTAVSVVTGRYYEAARLTRTFGLGESRVLFSSAAVDFLEREHLTGHVFNDDALGGYLLWRDPARRVFIDGRLQVYPAKVYAQYQAVLDDPRIFPAVAAHYGIDAAILYHPAPGRLELARAIARIPGWRVAYLDGAAAVLRAGGRDGPLPAGLQDTLDDRYGGLDGLLSGVRPRIEKAILHYQRGRAALFLLGSAGATAALSDFRVALETWPALDDARAGIAAAQHASPVLPGR